MNRPHRIANRNSGHSRMEHMMLLSIELSRERIRDMESRLAELNPAARADAVRRSRRAAAAEARWLGSRA
jgi:hypothetical protein